MSSKLSLPIDRQAQCVETWTWTWRGGYVVGVAVVASALLLPLLPQFWHPTVPRHCHYNQTQRVPINWYASDWLESSMRIHLWSQRKRQSQRVGSSGCRTENAFDCALRNISTCAKYPIPMPITLYMHHEVIKHPSAIRPAQIARNDSASDMLELDERLGASWLSASASAACIEKPKVAARYCA